MMYRMTALVALACAALPVAATAQSGPAVVYCVNDRIRVERTTIQQLRVHQPHAPICIIGPSFDFQPDGVTWVRQNLRSDVGGSCRCN
ncbi:hypothetical protein [Roseomonas rosulenta]|uniref:hypothetical protein n=1 Tax=Roseomonas rosulenta TaxID=2748667 RepID=UPI0018DF9EB6|nr:hypothetical protein [Roseomonas rosulenta]